jgi:hypothetical protein
VPAQSIAGSPDSVLRKKFIILRRKAIVFGSREEIESATVTAPVARALKPA